MQYSVSNSFKFPFFLTVKRVMFKLIKATGIIKAIWVSIAFRFIEFKI